MVSAADVDAIAVVSRPVRVHRPGAVRFTAGLTVSNVVEFGASLVSVTVDDAGTACYQRADAPMTA